MANIDMVPAVGMGVTIQDARWTPTDVVSPIAAADFTATQDLRTLDARLAVLNAGYWTATRLQQESVWDKLYWLRVNQGGQASLA